MHIKRMYLLIAACVVLLLICTNILQFLIWGQKVMNIENTYKMQLEAVNEQIDSIGPIINAWTVADNVTAGQKITKEDLKPLETLQKSMGKSFITNVDQLVGKFYKVAVIPGTPITQDLIMEVDIQDSLRQYDVVTDMIPIGLKVGDYIDYRLVMPEGEDYIAMSHKRVEGIYGKTVTLHLTQEEIHIYQSMLLDSFLMKGSYIYMTKYLEPSKQLSAIAYYRVNPNIAAVVAIDPNIFENIKTQIVNRKRAAIAAEDKNIGDTIRKNIIEGHKFIQDYLDSANSAYWDIANGSNVSNDLQSAAGNNAQGGAQSNAQGSVQSNTQDSAQSNAQDSAQSNLQINPEAPKTDGYPSRISPNQQPLLKQPARNVTPDTATSKSVPKSNQAEDKTSGGDTGQSTDKGDDGLNILEGVVQ